MTPEHIARVEAIEARSNRIREMYCRALTTECPPSSRFSDALEFWMIAGIGYTMAAIGAAYAVIGLLQLAKAVLL